MPRSLATLRDYAAETGAVLVESYRDAQGRIVGVWEVPDAHGGDPMATARLLELLSNTDEAVGELPLSLIQLAERRGPAALHAYVKRAVRFRPEKGEVFQSPGTTLALGYGDCDDSARLLVAAARAAGYPAELVYFLQGGQPAHVTAVVDGRWAEATVDARYGEHPFAACCRLGRKRPDMNGMAVLLSGGSVSMGAMTALPSSLGPDFPAILAQLSEKIGADPLDVLKLLLSESGLQPTAANPRGFPAGQFAAGINQLAPVNWHYFAPLTAAQYIALSAEEQLPYAFAYFNTVMRGAGLSSITGRDLYVLNFLPAFYKSGQPDSAVLVSSSSGYYKNNASTDPSKPQGLDHGRKGYISYGDMQIALDAQMKNPLYQLLAPMVASGVAPPSSGSLVLLLAAGLGAALARPDLIDRLFRSF